MKALTARQAASGGQVLVVLRRTGARRGMKALTARQAASGGQALVVE
ncbi:MAG: hypothetical protein ABSH05_03440 [Bryobacteraceae bacterium]